MVEKVKLKDQSKRWLRKRIKVWKKDFKALSIELKNINQIKETALNSCSSLLVKQSELRKRIEDELACYNSQLKEKDKRIEELDTTLSNLKGEFTTVKQREISWKAQFDAEVYYKNQAINKSKELSIQLTRLEDSHGDLKQHARSLEKSLASTARDKDKHIADLEHALDFLGMSLDESKKIHFKDKTMERHLTDYIGEIPEELVMGVDGQLKNIKDMTQDEAHSAYVNQTQVVHQGVECIITEFESDLDDTGFKVLLDPQDGVKSEFVSVEGTGHQPFDEPTNGVSEPAKIDEAVEWAKRNGHHFPNGKPDKDRMKEVSIPSAEEISQENRTRSINLGSGHSESKLKDYVDPMFDEKGKSHQSID